jgi:hypothetical protein
MSRADHYAAGDRDIVFYVSAGERLAIMGTAIFECMQRTVELNDRNVEAIDLGIEPAS